MELLEPLKNLFESVTAQTLALAALVFAVYKVWEGLAKLAAPVFQVWRAVQQAKDNAKAIEKLEAAHKEDISKLEERWVSDRKEIWESIDSVKEFLMKNKGDDT